MSTGSERQPYDALWMLERKTRDLTAITIEPIKPLGDHFLTTNPSTSNPLAMNMSYYPAVPVQKQQRQPHVCSDCGKCYKWNDSLKRHKRVECGNKEKQFACFSCDKKFKYRYELRNHISAYH